jgi:hypothetical protein
MVTMSQKMEIIAMLKEGNCTTHMIVSRFGRNATRRLRVLREEGHKIETTRLSLNNYAYRLVERSSPPAKKRIPKQKKVAPMKAKRASKAVVHEPYSNEWWADRRRVINGLVWVD